MEFFGLKSIDDLFEDVDLEEDEDEIIVISDSDSEDEQPKAVDHRKSLEVFNKRMSTVGATGTGIECDGDADQTIIYDANITTPILSDEQKQLDGTVQTKYN